MFWRRKPAIDDSETKSRLAALAERDRLRDARRMGVAKRLQDFASMAVESKSGRQEAAGWVNDRNEFVKHYRGSVYIAVSAIARRIAMQPVHVGVRRVRKSGIEIEPVSPTHPLMHLFEHVNARQTQYDLWFLTTAWRLITGDAYWWKVRNGLRVPAELWVIPSHWVRAIPGPKKFIDEYEVRSLFGKPTRLPAEDVVQISEPSVNWQGSGRFYGHSVMSGGATMVDIEESMLNQLLHRFRNYAPPGLHYSTDQEFDDEQVMDVISQIMAQHAVAETSGRPIVTHSGFKAEDFSRTIREMDYRGSLEAALEYQLSIHGVPKAVVGLVKDSNRANMQGAMMAFCENTVNPLLVHIGQHLTQNLAAEFDENLIVWFDKCTVDDADQIRKETETLMRHGATTPNEAREILSNLGPYKVGGDVPLVPANLAESTTFGNVEPEEEQPEEPEEPEVTEPEVTDDVDEDTEEPEELEETEEEKRALVSRVGKYLSERRRSLLGNLLGDSNTQEHVGENEINITVETPPVYITNYPLPPAAEDMSRGAAVHKEAIETGNGKSAIGRT